MSDSSDNQAGWIVGQSIAMELDTALWLIGERVPTLGASAPEHVRQLASQAPPEWREQMSLLLGELPGPPAILEVAAFLADVLVEPDYSRATLAIRELTVEKALRSLLPRLPAAREATGAPPERQLVELLVEEEARGYDLLGLTSTSPDALRKRKRTSMEYLTRILRGGDLHARFWHWLDRFYYETYREWRATREDALAALERATLDALGSRESPGVPPVEWLPIQNPLRVRPTFHEALAAGQFRLFFWLEPFELADIFTVLPGLLVVAVASPGTVFESFRISLEDLASRVKALSDPTRLFILRLIRNFSMDNTSMAEFLELSRPTVSIHARILREAGFIRTRYEGRQAFHEIEPAELRRLFRELERFLDLPDEGDA